MIFDAIDTNADGGIAAEEFATYFTSLGVNDAAFAAQVFKAMDTDGDGSLSRAEFSSFGTQFFLGQDAAHASKNFFGPLVA